MDEVSEQVLKRRRDNKRRRMLAGIGKPCRVFPHEFQEVLSRLQTAHAAGMSSSIMGEQTGIHQTTLEKILRGVNKTVSRRTYDAVMTRLMIVPPEAKEGYASRRSGARMPQEPVARKLQALIAAGYNNLFLASYLGNINPRNLSIITNGNQTYVFAATHYGVDAMYRKLRYTDPVDLGISRRTITMMKNLAAKKGWAPDSCWDEDTINDPEARPEWTGACGTEEGYRIHLRENINVCDACNTAMGGGIAGEKLTFSALKFRELIEARGLSYAKVGPMLGVTGDTARRWGNGSNAPQTGHYQTILHVLGVEPEEVFDTPEGVDYITEGDFNRHKLRVAMEQAGMSAHSLSKATGVSHTSLHNWVAGNKIPKAENVRKVAEYFGVDWEVFYK